MVLQPEYFHQLEFPQEQIQPVPELPQEQIPLMPKFPQEQIPLVTELRMNR